MNLLNETLSALTENGKNESDVLFCAVDEKQFTFDKFKEISDFIYDAGYGGNEISRYLIIVGDNWWLERGEYDGSEWWDFKTIPRFTELNDDVITSADLKE